MVLVFVLVKLFHQMSWELHPTTISRQHCTPPLQSSWVYYNREHFLRLNKTLVDPGKRIWNTTLTEYRTSIRQKALQKHQVLSYSFYINIYCNPHLQYQDIPLTLARQEVNPILLGIPSFARSSLVYLFERMVVVNQSKVHRWWYIPCLALLCLVRYLWHAWC